MHTIQGETYLSKREALAYVNRSDSWLRSRVEKGILKKYTLDNPRVFFYKRSEIVAALVPGALEQEAPEDADFLTLTQVGRKLQVTTGYVWQLVKTDRIMAINVSGKTGQGAIWRIHKDELSRFVREREADRLWRVKESV